MTDQDKRRIAELCGWTDIRVVQAGYLYYGTNPQGERKPLPDYEHSLDACAVCEAEGIEVDA